MFPFLWPKLLWDHGCYMPELFRSNWSQNISLPNIQAKMLGGIFAPTRRATHHEVILNAVVFIKHLLFSFLIPQWGIYKGKMHSKRTSLILQDPLANNNLWEGGYKWDRYDLGGSWTPVYTIVLHRFVPTCGESWSRPQSWGAGE